MRLASVRLCAVWLALGAAYALFVGSFSLDEAALGAACAGLGTAWWAFAARRSGIRFRAGGTALGPLPASILALPGATLRVGADLVRALTGRLDHGSVRPAPEAGWARAEGPSAPAVRAVGLLADSLAPDSYVLRLDAPGTVTVHALAGAGAGA